MKKLFFLILVFMFIGCAEDLIENRTSCDGYSDLCRDGSNIRYEICSDDYDVWYEVGGETYYTTDYMLSEECGF